MLLTQVDSKSGRLLDGRVFEDAGAVFCAEDDQVGGLGGHSFEGAEANTTDSTLKIHLPTMLLDTSYNSVASVERNVGQIMHEAARRSQAYLECIRPRKKTLTLERLPLLQRMSSAVRIAPRAGANWIYQQD